MMAAADEAGRDAVPRSTGNDKMNEKNQSSFFGERLEEFVPKGDINAFKVAAYNTALLVFVGACFAGICAVYHLLFAFLKPMLWAVLVGTVLFPFKRVVTDAIRGWLRNLHDSGTPLALGVVILPVKWLDGLSEGLWSILTSSSIFYIIGGYVGMQFLTYERAFIVVVRIIARIYLVLDVVIQVFSKYWAVPVALVYVTGFLFWTKIQMSSEGGASKRLAHILCSPIWFWFLCFGSSFFSFLRVPIFVGASVLLALLASGALPGFRGKEVDRPEEESQVEDEKTEAHHSSASTQDELSAGDRYLRTVLGACLLLWTVRHTWLLLLFAIPLTFAIGKKVGCRIGVLSMVQSKVNDGIRYFLEQFGPVIDIAVPSTLRNFFKILFTGDQKIIVGLERSLDVISSVVVMISFLLAAVFVGIFVVVQIHGETVHLLRVGKSVLDSEEGMPGWMAGAMNFTGSKLSEHGIDNYVEDGYQYGRAWLAEHVRKLADPADVERADMLEAEIKQLVDKIYEALMSEHSGATAMKRRESETVGDIWSHLQLSLDLSHLKDEISLIVQENIGTLLSVAESVWAVLVVNLTIILSFFTAIMGLVLSFGLELLNLIIGIIVFLTMLYYLLACSKNQLKPLEFLGNLSFTRSDNGDHTDNKGFSSAVEQAIRDVFLLSFKMSLFYGTYTWFIHTLFDLNVVFVPSILASLFAAVPLTAPYWVSIPGALELWLIRDEGTAALLFLICSVAPICFADTAFYHEVRGSHPYVTGLAIVGGLYWLGLEGAIIGPILLCCMLVLLNFLSTSTG